MKSQAKTIFQSDVKKIVVKKKVRTYKQEAPGGP